MGRLTASEGRFGYASRHLLVSRDRVPEAHYEPLQSASIQLRTVLQHAWAEFEHDIRYKGHHPAGAGAGPRSSLHPSPPACSNSPTGSSARSVTGCRSVSVRASWSPATTRGSAPRNWRPSSPVATPAPAGHAPSTTEWIAALLLGSASRRWTS